MSATNLGCSIRCTRWGHNITATVHKPQRDAGAATVLLQILAAASDNIIRVWCAHTGALLQLLKGHTQQAHVLEMHPHDPRLALSGGYDGMAILWDITTGAILKR